MSDAATMGQSDSEMSEREMVDRVIHGDALEVIRALPDNSIDSIVTDPP